MVAGAVPDCGVTFSQFPPFAVAAPISKVSVPLLELVIDNTCVGAGSPCTAVKRRNCEETPGLVTALDPSVKVTGMIVAMVLVVMMIEPWYVPAARPDVFTATVMFVLNDGADTDPLAGWTV